MAGMKTSIAPAITPGIESGKVTLQGPAPSTEARQRAEAIAKAVKGVSSVSNQLVVAAG